MIKLNDLEGSFIITLAILFEITHRKILLYVLYVTLLHALPHVINEDNAPGNSAV